MTDAEYVDDPALFANTPVPAESLPHSQEQAARGSYFDINMNKTEFMCFKQDATVSCLNSKPLKLFDQLTYYGSNISSTECDVNIRIWKAWTVIDKLSMEQSAGTAEYTDWFCAEVEDSPNECSGYDTKKIWWWGSSNAGNLGNAKHPFFSFIPKSTLIRCGNTI